MFPVDPPGSSTGNADFIGIGRAPTQHRLLCRAAPGIAPKDGLSCSPRWGRFFCGNRIRMRAERSSPAPGPLNADRAGGDRPSAHAKCVQKVRPYRLHGLGAEPLDALGRVVAGQRRQVDAGQRLGARRASPPCFRTARRSTRRPPCRPTRSDRDRSAGASHSNQGRAEQFRRSEAIGFRERNIAMVLDDQAIDAAILVTSRLRDGEVDDFGHRLAVIVGRAGQSQGMNHTDHGLRRNRTFRMTRRCCSCTLKHSDQAGRVDLGHRHLNQLNMLPSG
jgi:hypothetical protein